MSVTSAEKSDLLNSISEKVLNNSRDFQKSLHTLLLRDSEGGKLYKYRAVNDNNLSCLESGTLYCPSPEEFNDPFDSKIGYSFQSFSDLIVGNKKIDFDCISSKFCDALQGDLSLENCSDYEKSIVSKWMNTKSIADFIEEVKSNISSVDLILYIAKNPSIVIDFILPFFDDATSDILRKSFISLCNIIGENGLMKLFETNGNLTLYIKENLVKEDVDDIDLLDRTFQIFVPENTNGRYAFQQLIKNIDTEIIKKIQSLFKIGCLSTSYKNRLMWSHYADSHKGYCVEYDFSGTDNYNLEHLPLPVVYSTSRPQIPWEFYANNTDDSKEAFQKSVLVGLLIKDQVWQYENEWRIMIEGSNNSLFKMPPISCLYLGAEITEDDENTLVKIATQKGIPVKKMFADRETYELHAREI